MKIRTKIHKIIQIILSKEPETGICSHCGKPLIYGYQPFYDKDTNELICKSCYEEKYGKYIEPYFS